MTTEQQPPQGRLKSIYLEWDSLGSWEKMPRREIAFNNRLSYQARIVWLWLAWTASRLQSGQSISWSECESVMNIHTKARRSCLSQLMTEGYITIDNDNKVTLHDPVIAYNKKIAEIRSEMSPEIFSFVCQSCPSAQLNQKAEVVNIVEKPTVQKPSSNSSVILTTWNEHKPESYAGIRTVSKKQLQSINAHLKNLNLKSDQTKELIVNVCNGLSKSNFWMTKVQSHGRKFSAVFGYGTPSDTKMKGVETLFNEGQITVQDLNPENSIVLTPEQEDIISGFYSVDLKLKRAIARNDQQLIDKYTKMKDQLSSDISDNSLEDYVA